MIFGAALRQQKSPNFHSGQSACLCVRKLEIDGNVVNGVLANVESAIRVPFRKADDPDAEDAAEKEQDEEEQIAKIIREHDGNQLFVAFTATPAPATVTLFGEAFERVALESAIADKIVRQLEKEREATAKGQEAAIARLKTDITTCEKQIDLLLNMRLNEQISEPEYISKKCVLVNQKAELKGKLEAFEHNRTNRFEPAIRFVLEAKQATILLAEGNQEKNRDFLKKIGSNFQMAEKSLAVEFKKPWNLLVEFNSAQIPKHAACGEISQKSNWRREGDSNPTFSHP